MISELVLIDLIYAMGTQSSPNLIYFSKFMTQWLVALLLLVGFAGCVKLHPSHNYLMNNANYLASWNPRFSGWRSPRTSWFGSNLGGWGRRSAYATSWSPNFSGWGRRSYWRHNAQTEEAADHKSADPTWNPNFSGFARPGVSPLASSIFTRSAANLVRPVSYLQPISYYRPSRTIIRRSVVTPAWNPLGGIRRTAFGGYNPTWNPSFSGFRRPINYGGADPTWNPNFSGFRRYY